MAKGDEVREVSLLRCTRSEEPVTLLLPSSWKWSGGRSEGLRVCGACDDGWLGYGRSGTESEGGGGLGMHAV